MSKIPSYRIVYNDLKSKIVDGLYQKGDLLPCESQLDEIYHVSRTTVRKAIGLLMQDGYITVKQGFGTRVVNNKTVQSLNCLTSLTETLKRKGHEVSVDGVYVEYIKADAFLAEQFELSEGADLVCIYRTHIADGKPVAIAKNYIVKDLVPGIKEKQSQISSLYQFLKEQYHISYTLAKDNISACNANYEEARVLRVEPNTALLTVNRKCYIYDRVCELALVKIIASCHEFEIFAQGEGM